MNHVPPPKTAADRQLEEITERYTVLSHMMDDIIPDLCDGKESSTTDILDELMRYVDDVDRRSMRSWAYNWLKAAVRRGELVLNQRSLPDGSRRNFYRVATADDEVVRTMKHNMSVACADEDDRCPFYSSPGFCTATGETYVDSRRITTMALLEGPAPDWCPLRKAVFRVEGK